jgi:mRNA-degrading endonuclease toxin of MazEF toxin-antitoxin module
MLFEAGDVVLVLFPFTNQTTSKQRPAVIVSNATYNRTKPNVILMAITATQNRRWRGTAQPMEPTACSSPLPSKLRVS